jgi:hypothetical protein
MLQVMCCYQASMLLVAIGNSVRMLNSRGRKEVKNSAWIEVNNEVYAFVDDQDHPQMIEIHAELHRLSGLLPDAGYMPCMKVDLYDVEEEEKVFHLCHHSEKLAIAFGGHQHSTSPNKKKSVGL